MNKLLKKLKHFKYKKVSSHVYQKKECKTKATVVLNSKDNKVLVSKLTYLGEDHNYENIFRKLGIEQRTLEDL